MRTTDATPQPGKHVGWAPPTTVSPRKRWRAEPTLHVTLFMTLTVLGCANPKGVPGGASLVTEATVKSSFQSPADGMLYIYRSASRGQRGQLHYSGPILAGQTLVIDPAMKQATLDGQPLDVVLPSGDVLYQAYFRRDPTVRQAVSAPPWRRDRTGEVREASGTLSPPGTAPGPGTASELQPRPDESPDAPADQTQ